jgi:hypothetical protein
MLNYSSMCIIDIMETPMIEVMQDVKGSVGQVPGFGGLEPSAPVLVSRFQVGTSSNFLELDSPFKKKKSWNWTATTGFELFQNPNWGLRVWVKMLSTTKVVI